MKASMTQFFGRFFQNGGRGAVIRQRRRIALTAGVVSLLAIVLITVWAVRRAPAVAVSESEELDQAIEDTLQTVVTHPAFQDRVKDQASLEEAVKVAFPIMHPQLALEERRKDPAYAALEAEARATFVLSEEQLAERMKDAEFVRQKEEAWRALTNGVNKPARQIFREWKEAVIDAKAPATE